MMIVKKILMMSHRSDEMFLKYFNSSLCAASTFISVSSTFESILCVFKKVKFYSVPQIRNTFVYMFMWSIAIIKIYAYNYTILIAYLILISLVLLRVKYTIIPYFCLLHTFIKLITIILYFFAKFRWIPSIIFISLKLIYSWSKYIYENIICVDLSVNFAKINLAWNRQQKVGLQKVKFEENWLLIWKKIFFRFVLTSVFALLNTVLRQGTLSLFFAKCRSKM